MKARGTSSRAALPLAVSWPLLDTVAVQTCSARLDSNLSCMAGHLMCKQDGGADPTMTEHTVEELFALKNQQSQMQEWKLCLSCFTSDEGTS